MPFIDFLSFALNVRAAVAANVRPLVGKNIGLGQRPFDKINGVRYITGAIGILNAQEKIAAVRLGEKVGVERRPQIADVHVSRRAWRKAGAYFRQCNDLPFS